MQEDELNDLCPLRSRIPQTPGEATCLLLGSPAWLAPHFYHEQQLTLSRSLRAPGPQFPHL